ncbi:MAG: hypothetical protein WCH11_07955, partial [Bdellovibrio sp.]
MNKPPLFELKIARALGHQSAESVCLELSQQLLEQAQLPGSSNRDLDFKARVLIWSNLCLYSGRFALLQETCLALLEHRAFVPWAHFAESFALTGQMSELMLEAFVRMAQEAEGLEELARSRSLLHTQIKDLQSLRARDKQVYAENRKADLLQQADIAGSQGLLKEQEKFLQLAKSVDANSIEVQQRLLLVRQKKLEQSAEKEHRRGPPWPLFWTSPLSDQEAQIVEIVVGSLLKTKNQLAPDEIHSFLLNSALLLNWMGAPEQALIFLHQMPEDLSRLGLEFEILSCARRFLDILELIQRVELRWSQNPEVL